MMVISIIIIITYQYYDNKNREENRAPALQKKTGPPLFALQIGKV